MVSFFWVGPSTHTHTHALAHTPMSWKLRNAFKKLCTKLKFDHVGIALTRRRIPNDDLLKI